MRRTRPGWAAEDAARRSNTSRWIWRRQRRRQSLAARVRIPRLDPGPLRSHPFFKRMGVTWPIRYHPAYHGIRRREQSQQHQCVSCADHVIHDHGRSLRPRLRDYTHPSSCGSGTEAASVIARDGRRGWGWGQNSRPGAEPIPPRKKFLCLKRGSGSSSWRGRWLPWRNE